MSGYFIDMLRSGGARMYKSAILPQVVPVPKAKQKTDHVSMVGLRITRRGLFAGTLVGPGEQAIAALYL